MSVATRNPFALLDEDDRTNSPPPETPPVPPAPQVQAASAKRSKGGPATRGGKYYSRGGARQNTDREQPASDDPPVASDTKQRRFDSERKEGRGRGRGSSRGRGRTYDKHSATGKIDSDKKIHNGWGGGDGNAEFKVEQAATLDAAQESGGLNDWGAPATDTAANDWGTPTQDTPLESAPGAEKPDGPRRRDRDQEEEDNTLTLDQYLAQQKEKDSLLLPKLETRKANEGEDDTIWGHATPLHKGQGDAYFAGKIKSTTKTRTEKKEKIYLEIDAHFERPARGGRGRGGDRPEGRGRGGRGRGRGRGVANGSTFVDVDDQSAFPSLS